MSSSEYNTVANLPISRIGEPGMRALVIQFAARCANPRIGAAVLAAVRRAG